MSTSSTSTSSTSASSTRAGTTQPTIVLAVPLDHHAEEVIDTARAIATRLGAAVLPVHAGSIGDEQRSHVRRNGGVRETIVAWMEPLVRAGVRVLEPLIERERPEHLVALAAARSGASLILAGSGRGATVRDWLLGSTAERIVRASAVPVFVARGTLPSRTAPVLAALDLGDESRLALAAALRWARAFGAPLRVLHVVREEIDVDRASAEDALARIELSERGARARIAELLESVDASGVAVEVRIAHGEPGAIVIGETSQCGLLVMVQPDWEMLVPASIGSRAERIVRMSRASLLAIRDDESERQRELREERWRWVVTLSREAEGALREGDPARAERLLANAKIVAPTSAPIEDALARAVDAQGRTEEAERHRALAKWLRRELEA